MKRSEINQILAEADDFMKEFKIELPPFAYWSPEEFVRQSLTHLKAL